MANDGRKQRFRLIFVISLSLICLLLATAAAIALNRVSSVVTDVRVSNVRLSEQLRIDREELSILSRNMALLTDDSNDVRFQIGLEPLEYTYTAPDDTEESRENDVVTLFEAVKTVLQHHDEQTDLAEFDEFLHRTDFLEFLDSNNLKIESTGSFSFGLVINSDRYFNIIYHPKDGQVEVIASYPKTHITEAWNSGLMARIRQLIPERELYFRYVRGKAKELAGLENHSRINELLTEKKVRLSSLREDSTSFIRSIVSGGKTFDDIILLKEDNRFAIAGNTVINEDELVELLIRKLEEIDPRPELERRVAESDFRLNEIFHEQDFKRLMESRGLTIDPEPKQDDYLVFYDILMKGERVGSFAINKFTAAVYVTDSDGVQIGSLQSFSGPSTKKKITSSDISRLNEIYESPGSVTFLACGKSHDLTDSIILIHVDTKRKRIILIGFPRDLFYRGQKINTISWIYGIEQFMRELTEISGLRIEKFIMIDMFALIEVIDTLGGVTVTLDEDLIDPTYKTKENGVWSTVYYKKGTYNLNGIQALRVARSRNFSSDFDRSLRQQKILESIYEELQSIGIRDLSRVYELINTLLSYVQTNLTPLEMVSYLNRFKSFSIYSRNVLDTSNVLYSTSTHAPNSEAAADTTDPAVNRGVYILLPKGDDWNVIKRHIGSLLGASAK